jgi:ABC-2 type transport system ATP-binding protein
VIRLRGLSKSFGGTAAVQGLDLEIPEGQLVGLLGPNSAGKSTTIRMLTGMVRPSAGTAEVFGIAHAAALKAIRSRPFSED